MDLENQKMGVGLGCCMCFFHSESLFLVHFHVTAAVFTTVLFARMQVRRKNILDFEQKTQHSGIDK